MIYFLIHKISLIQIISSISSFKRITKAVHILFKIENFTLMLKNLHHVRFFTNSRTPSLPPSPACYTHRHGTLKSCDFFSEMRIFTNFFLNKSSQPFQFSLFFSEQRYLLFINLLELFNFFLLFL